MSEDFSESDIPQELIEAFPPDPTSLFEMLCDMITDDMLLEIARKDFGHEVEENLAGLRDIVEHRRVPDFLDGNPRDVLALSSMFPLLANDKRAQTIRAFCSACFLSQDTIDDIDSAMAVSASALHLNAEVRRAACGALTFLLEQGKPWLDGFPFHAFALTALAHTDRLLSDAALERLADWLLTVDLVATQSRTLPYGQTPPSFAHAVRINSSDCLIDLARALTSSTNEPRLVALCRRIWEQ